MNRERKHGRSYPGSAIIRTLNHLTAALYALIARSALGRAFCGCYEALQRTFEQSALYGWLHGPRKRSDRLLFRTRLRLSYQMERSALCRLLRWLCHTLLAAGMSTYGIFFFFFGCYSVISYLLLYVTSGASRSYLISGVAMVAAALPLFTSGNSLARTLGGSRVCRWLIVDMLGIPAERMDSMPQRGKDHYLGAMLTAVLCGLLTALIPPHGILLLALSLLALWLVMQYPEIGLLLSIFVAPLLSLLPSYRPTALLLLLVLLTALSYFLKLIRGKRILRMELSDYFVLLLLALLFAGGLVTRGGTASVRSALTYATLMLGYFLTVNLARSPVWMRRMQHALLLSGVTVALLGLLQHYLGADGAEYFDLSLFADLGGRVSSTMENPNMLAEFLILLLPLGIALAMTQRRVLHGFLLTVCTAVMAICLIYTWSRGAWLGAMISLVCFLLLLGNHWFSALVLGVLPGAALLHYLPDTVVRRFTSIGSMTDTSIRYRVYLWQGVEDMLSDVWLCGVGVGESAFREVYTQYALPGIESAAHSHNLYLQLTAELGVAGLAVFVLCMLLLICRVLAYLRGRADRPSKIMSAAGLCGVLAFLLMGMTDHVWYNYRMFFLFWIVVGLTSAQMRIGCDAIASAAPIARNTKTSGEMTLYL